MPPSLPRFIFSRRGTVAHCCSSELFSRTIVSPSLHSLSTMSPSQEPWWYQPLVTFFTSFGPATIQTCRPASSATNLGSHSHSHVQDMHAANYINTRVPRGRHQLAPQHRSACSQQSMRPRFCKQHVGKYCTSTTFYIYDTRSGDPPLSCLQGQRTVFSPRRKATTSTLARRPGTAVCWRATSSVLVIVAEFGHEVREGAPVVEHEVAHAQEGELVDAAAAVGERALADAAQAGVVVSLQRVLACERHPCTAPRTQ